MICCEVEHALLAQAREHATEADASLADWTDAYQAQQEYTQLIGSLISGAGAGAAAVAREAAQQALAEAQEALTAAEAVYAQLAERAANLSQQVAAAEGSALFTVEELAAAASAAWAEAEAAAARIVGLTARVAMWETIVAISQAVFLSMAGLASTWCASQAAEQYYKFMMQQAGQQAKSAHEALKAAEQDLHQCENTAVVCRMCGKCVGEAEAQECQGCGGYFCLGCYSSFIEQKEMMEALGGVK